MLVDTAVSTLEAIGAGVEESGVRGELREEWRGQSGALVVSVTEEVVETGNVAGGQKAIVSRAASRTAFQRRRAPISDEVESSLSFFGALQLVEEPGQDPPALRSLPRFPLWRRQVRASDCGWCRGKSPSTSSASLVRASSSTRDALPPTPPPCRAPRPPYSCLLAPGDRSTSA